MAAIPALGRVSALRAAGAHRTNPKSFCICTRIKGELCAKYSKFWSNSAWTAISIINLIKIALEGLTFLYISGQHSCFHLGKCQSSINNPGQSMESIMHFFNSHVGRDFKPQKIHTPTDPALHIPTALAVFLEKKNQNKAWEMNSKHLLASNSIVIKIF